jgi:hypothetical protein
VCLFIDAEKATDDNPDGYSAARLCRMLGINRSAFYAWLASRSDAIERLCAEGELAGQIRAVHVKSRGCRVPRNAGRWNGPRGRRRQRRRGWCAHRS